MRMQSNNFLHSVRTDIHVSYSGPGFFFSRAAGCFGVSHRPKSRERSEDLTETAETAHEKSLAPRVIYSIYSIF